MSQAKISRPDAIPCERWQHLPFLHGFFLVLNVQTADFSNGTTVQLGLHTSFGKRTFRGQRGLVWGPKKYFTYNKETTKIVLVII